MGHNGGEKWRHCIRAEVVDSGDGRSFEFFAYKHVSLGNCKRQKREAAIAEGRMLLTTRGSEGAS